MSFDRSLLPDPETYYTHQAGLVLQGRGKQRQTRCEFHGGSDSMGINIESGAFLCRAACGAKGGDVLAYHRAAHGLGFVEAAKALGAYLDDGKTYQGSTRPTPIPARDLLAMVAPELTLAAICMSDILNGRLNDDDYERFIVAVGRVIHVAEVANA